MGQFSLENLFGMTIRESANDGSDFTNPDADYRRLFLGEDGLLHLKDSSGTVTDIGSGSGIAATIFDAKGDLIAASAADTAARLAAGANGTVLTAASGETTGLKWAGPGSYENYITASVTVVNADTWYAGPAVTPTAGDYLVIYHLTMTSSFSGSTSCSGGLGTSSPPTLASAQAYVGAANQVVSLTGIGRFTVNGSETITAYGLASRGSSVASILDTASSGAITDKASSIIAIRVTSL